jgi:hypothetical protein
LRGILPTLYVDALDGIVRCRLERPDRGGSEPLEQEVSHALDRATLGALQRGADTLLHGPGGRC